MAKFIVLTAVAMLVVACVASLSEDKPKTSKAAVGLSESSPETPERPRARARRSVSLPEDQREHMSRQLLQALSEIVQREDCVSDYQGWVDFGRRSAK